MAAACMRGMDTSIGLSVLGTVGRGGHKYQHGLGGALHGAPWAGRAQIPAWARWSSTRYVGRYHHRCRVVGGQTL
jgi:nicotinamide mononucleotide (NMN) deamidase PncC